MGAEINKAKEVGKKKKTTEVTPGSGSGRMLRNLEDDAQGSFSSSPASEEVPYGEPYEATDFSEGGITAEVSASGSGSGNSDDGTGTGDLNSWGGISARPGA